MQAKTIRKVLLVKVGEHSKFIIVNTHDRTEAVNAALSQNPGWTIAKVTSPSIILEED
jgi:hypothetical protein